MPVDHSPGAALIPINMCDAQCHGYVAVHAAQPRPAPLDPDGVAEVATDIAGQILDREFSAGKTRRCPCVARLEITPASLPTTPSAEEGCVISMGANLRPRSDVAVDETVDRAPHTRHRGLEAVGRAVCRHPALVLSYLHADSLTLLHAEPNLSGDLLACLSGISAISICQRVTLSPKAAAAPDALPMQLPGRATEPRVCGKYWQCAARQWPH